ncbi:MAG: UTRA domain-containing protein, partial [Vallitaleaceae bacterium]|nr:UTRA domain-containing protein [Vallitaleaceae bacterium]
EEPLTALLAQNIHTKLAYTTYDLQAATATKDDCTLLDISKITAVQLVHSIGYNKFQTPIEYSISRYRGDKNVFKVAQTESN